MMLKLLNRRKDLPETAVSRVSKHGQHGYGGGAWNQLAQMRMWMETNVDNAGLYPFITGTARPRTGAPIGYDLTNGSAVAMDHISLFYSEAISSPSCMLMGLNGLGKSSLAGLISAYINSTGVPLAVFDPIKGEWAEYARAIGADVFQIGTRSGNTKINPMDPGPLAAAGTVIGGEAGQAMWRDAITNIAHNIIALVRINRGQDKSISDSEATMIKLAVQAVMDQQSDPALGHLLDFFKHPSEKAISAAGLKTPEQFMETYADLFRSLSALLYGELAEIFSDKGMTITPGNPGGFCFDSSSIPDSHDRMISAVMMSTWRLGMNAIDAHWELSQFEAKKAAEAAAEGETYIPQYVWRGYSSLMDEFWHPVRMAKGMVQEVDRLSRTNRSVGVGELKITHSPKDFLMLPDEADRNIARSLIEKCGLWILMAMTEDDVDTLSKIRKINDVEKAWVTGFMSGSQGLEYHTAHKGSYDEETVLPGAGKALWKVGDSLGIPVQSPKPRTLRKLHKTNTRFDKE